jgi:ribosomal protein L32E
LYVLSPKATRGLEPISYRGVLVSTLLHATVYMFLHNLLNVPVQIANKMGLQKKLGASATLRSIVLSPDDG